MFFLDEESDKAHTARRDDYVKPSGYFVQTHVHLTYPMPGMRHTQGVLTRTRQPSQNTLKTSANIGWKFFELSMDYAQIPKLSDVNS